MREVFASQRSIFKPTRLSFIFGDGGGKRGQKSGGLVAFQYTLSLLEWVVLSERPAAVKGAPLLRGEANP
jgi:hypothetical protein